MKTNKILMILAFCTIIVSSSCIPQAVAHNAGLEGSCFIPTFIKPLDIHIKDSTDIPKYTEIEIQQGDTHPNYEMKSISNVAGYPASSITSLTNPPSNPSIIGKDDTFNITVTIPRGVYFCILLDVDSITVTNKITVSCSDPSGKYSDISGGVHYLGMDSNGNLTNLTGSKNTAWSGAVTYSLPDNTTMEDMWIHSETEDITITLEGERGSTAIFDWNIGNLRVSLIMKPTIVGS